MGYRTTQRILECAQCKETPDDGEYLWEMCGSYYCEKCVDNIEEVPEVIEGTRAGLEKLTIR